MNAGFFTRVVVLAGLVQLATSELTVEGQAGDLLAAEARQGAQGPWTQMHVHNLYALQSEKTREELGLTKKQKRQIDELLAEYNSAWQDYLAENRDGQRKTGRKAFDELTDQQKAALKGLDSIERMWFNAVQWPGIGEKLGLDDVQKKKKKKIDAVMADHNQKRTQAFQSVQTRLTPEMVAKSREVQQQYQELVEDAKKAIRDVLSDKQFDALITEIAVMQLPGLVRQKRFPEDLALTEAQIAQIETMQQATDANLRQRATKAWETRRQLEEKLQQVLTPKQKAQLDEKSRDRMTPRNLPR